MNRRRNWPNLILILCLFSLGTVGCDANKKAAQTATETAGMQKVVLMLNWYPEAEHGGFYAAKVHGIFEKYGLDVEIRPGGPNAPVAQELLTGRVQFGIANADDVLIYHQSKADIVALLAPLQNTPRCIMVHADSPVKELTQLSGLTLHAERGQAFLTFMEHKELLRDVKIVPYAFPNFLSNKNSATQAYSFSEPQVAKQQNIETRSLMVSDIGFNPYASCLIATSEYVDKNKDLVGRMVIACREGWQKYLESPEKTNEAILQLNPHGMTTAALAFGAESLRELCLPQAMPNSQLGQMTIERWKTLVDQFMQIGLAEAQTVKAERVFNNEFLNRSGNQ
jgi:NitT/TauT family transport system substrate-binding protein